jgi:hypothetical protein
MLRSRILQVSVAAIVLGMGGTLFALNRDRPTLEELKARVGAASVADRPPLCLHVAEEQLKNAADFYSAGESEKAQAALADVAAYAQLDRDYAIQSHKHEKQSEIAIRKMVRKLSDMKHTVTRDEQAQLQTTIEQLEKVRDDLLASMFPQGGKK